MIARQNHIQKKISKNLEKEQKILEIKTILDKDFEKYLQDKRSSTGTKLDERKLKIELNQLIFKNLCKEKTLQSLKLNALSMSEHRRSVSVNFSTVPESRIIELQEEIQEVQQNISKECEESDLLHQICLREKTAIRSIKEKSSKLRENENDLQKFTEKLTRTTVLAGNLYESSSKSLQNSRKILNSKKSDRMVNLKNLKKKEMILNNQVQKMKSKLSDRIYSEYEIQARRSSLSSRLEIILSHNKDSEQEQKSNLNYLNSINLMHKKLVHIIKSSKFIPEACKEDKIPLSEIGEFLNTIIFAEGQLQVRCSELINLQNIHKKKVNLLKTEVKEIKEKFEDSQFIEKWKQKKNSQSSLESSENFDKGPYVEKLENLCFELFRVLSTMQEHISRIVKKVNVMSIETLDKFVKANQLMRKRTLSSRNNFSILPVIKEPNEMFSPFEFEKLIASFFTDKFKCEPSKSKTFLAHVSRYRLLKQFLTASDLNEYFVSKDTIEEVETSYVKLFKPAHDNLRERIVSLVKYSSSFIVSIAMMYNQILNSFEKYTLTDAQFSKYITLFPNIKLTDTNFKAIIKTVIKYQLKNYDMETVKKEIKRQSYIKRNTIRREIDSPVEVKEKEVVRVHRRTTSQKEIKTHLDKLNIKLVKSSKRING